jgi:hypothetical protein
MTNPFTTGNPQRATNMVLWLFMCVFTLFSNSSLLAQGCDPDVTPPNCQAPPNVTVSCEAFDPTLTSYGTATATDNCCLDTVIITNNYTLFDTLCDRGTITRVFRAFDCAGNGSTLGVVSAMQTIVVTYEQSYSVRFPDDVVIAASDVPADAWFGTPSTFMEDCENIGISYEDVITPKPALGRIDVERTWSVFNWCTYDPALDFIMVPNPTPSAISEYAAPNLPGPMVSASGTPAPLNPTITKINPTDPAPTDFSTFYSTNSNGYRYTQHIYIIDTLVSVIQGKVYGDADGDCTYDPGETQFYGRTVFGVGNVTGTTYETQTDANGNYWFGVLPDETEIEVSIGTPLNSGNSCGSSYTVPVLTGQANTQNLSLYLTEDCAILSVDISAPFLRRCFDNNYYHIHACNESSDVVEDAYVVVNLDPYMSYVSSSIPGTQTVGNPLERTFPLGDLPPGECVNFTVRFLVSCDAISGASHCTEAQMFPQVICDKLGNWEGANLRLTGECAGNTVKLSIENTGTGNMTESHEFVVVEDVIMRQATPFQLNSGEKIDIEVPANGATWHLSASQPSAHPFTGVEGIAVEGCGGLNNLGLVAMFPFNSPNPFIATDCQRNIGAYDPNDKQAMLVGYGEDHLLEKNTPIDYMIRFQNTGTDTAFNVVVLDTLSANLDPASVRPGAASHAYDFSILNGNVLRFRFANILLPDSSTNLEGSNGFFKFSVAQRPDNPDGTRIENSAAIYFDFNEPIITNTVFHTIGTHFVMVSVSDLPDAMALHAYPNPARGSVTFEIPETGGQFALSNNLGQTLRSVAADQSLLRVDCAGLAPGVYIYRYQQPNGKAFAGKLLIGE